MHQMSKYLAGIALSLAVSAANSATIGLQPTSAIAAPGGTASFALVVNLGTQTLFGGATDIKFDSSVLSFASFVFDPSFGPFGTDSIPPFRDSSLDRIDLQSPGLVSIGFANYFTGITGAFTAGTLTFNVAPSATKGEITTLTMADSVKWGAFGGPFGVPNLTYSGASVTINTATAPVPEPTSTWLFASGLALLGIVTLRRRADLA